METANTIRNKLVQTISIMVIAYTFSLLAYFFPEFSLLFNQKHEIWFQRSGSLVVVVSIWAEFILIRTEGYLDPHNEKYMTASDMPTYLNSLHYYISKVVIVFAIYGTLVWGYGDLFV